MLRNSRQPWWKRLVAAEPVPAYVQEAASALQRRCPECRDTYDVRDHYCPRCHTATPEWRYG
ncbi:MAG: hypothetical protein IPI33_09590 [Dehalococcoidia bacterium]|jgi:uncharacterized OB-fold protein|uniref:hypothetical protein n=1 Tax=Candidatus Amarobacter glycogenicus TaxID=3140699 RepID=UPI001DA1D533|nr:hypothetical protein [Dehalococcoidia bacterium]MBK7126420.1 hypothetical protein [Dehalococcoidia bacterium]MBK7330850.1 hypothetical protein [Dehalococcoidia bacterium]MBK7725459.1 hypothetical protein [Dehalococcoidia bacterium]MBK8560965.1 hypothetical protein [Dehalococcoidia bacterium]